VLEFVMGRNFFGIIWIVLDSDKVNKQINSVSINYYIVPLMMVIKFVKKTSQDRKHS
jgi:hypothetical protein